MPQWRVIMNLLELPLYLLVTVFFIAFSLWYILSGLFREKLFEIIMLMASLSFVTVYCIGDVIVKSTSSNASVTTIKWVNCIHTSILVLARDSVTLLSLWC